MLDQFAIGTYGVLACESMASQRVVVSHVSQLTRSHVADAGFGELPILEATPETIEDVIAGLLTDRDAARAQAAAGRRFTQTLHDGRRSAQILADHLHLRG